MSTDTVRPLPNRCGPPSKTSCPQTDSTWETMSPWRNSWGLGPSRPAIRCWRSREKTIRWSSSRYSFSRFFRHADRLAPPPPLHVYTVYSDVIFRNGFWSVTKRWTRRAVGSSVWRTRRPTKRVSTPGCRRRTSGWRTDKRCCRCETIVDGIFLTCSL